MPFNDAEREFFDSLYWEKSHPIREKYDSALKKLDYVNDINKHSLYLEKIKEFAREEISALVKSYIEVYERVGRTPDETDFEAFVDELKSLVPRFQEYFARRYRGPFSQLPVDLVDRILETLSLQVGEIIGLALTPLRRFMSEKKLEASLIKPPLKVFISYKWEDDAHNKWVEKFATDLRTAGIDAKLDKWEVRFGDSFTDYMTSKIAEADVVLFIMSSRSVAAAEAPRGEGGAVKFEMQMATSRRIAGEKMRLIGIYREGNQTAAHLRDHRYADFRDDTQYLSSLQELIDDLLGKEKRPPLGDTGDSNLSQHNLGKIVSLLNEEKRAFSTEEIAERLGINKVTVLESMRLLLEKGILEKADTSAGGGWRYKREFVPKGSTQLSLGDKILIRLYDLWLQNPKDLVGSQRFGDIGDEDDVHEAIIDLASEGLISHGEPIRTGVAQTVRRIPLIKIKAKGKDAAQAIKESFGEGK